MKKQAKESAQVKTARKKLEKTFEAEKQAFTPESLHLMSNKIRESFVRKHPEANFLKKRKFAIFTQNANPAKTKSKQILKLEQMLAQNFANPRKG